MSSIQPAITLCALLLATSATAQQTIVVDKAGGPGSEFTEIQPAIDAAQPWDLISVRPLAAASLPYNGFRVDKSLRIVGGPGVRVGGSSSFWSIAIENLALSEVVVLRGLEENSNGPFSAGLWIRNNLGTVHCEEVDPLLNVIIDNSQRVSFHNCQLAPVTSTNSNVLFVDCNSTGFYEAFCPCHQHPLEVIGGRVTIAGGTWTGADGFTGVRGGPGIRLRSGRVVITGNFDTAITAGSGGGGEAAIRTDGGMVVLDPGPVLTSTGANPPVSGPATVESIRVPYLTSFIENGELVTALNTWVGAQAFLAVGTSVRVVPLPGLAADLWVGRPIIASVSTVTSQVHYDTLPLPPLPPGLALPIQYLVVNGGTLALSNADIKVLDP